MASAEVKPRLLVEWRKLDHSIIVAAISQWHRRLSARVTAHGGQFEHISWCFHSSLCQVLRTFEFTVFDYLFIAKM